MKHQAIIIAVLLSSISTPAFACDGSGLEERVKAVSECDGETTDTERARRISGLSNYIAGCGDYSGLGEEELSGIKRALDSGKQSLQLLKRSLTKGTSLFAGMDSDERLKRLSEFEPLEKVFDDASGKLVQAQALLQETQGCENYQPGRILTYTHDIYLQNNSGSSAAVTVLSDYINSCIEAAPNLTAKTLDSVTSELEQAQAWVEQTLALEQFKSAGDTKNGNLDAAGNELIRGLNFLGVTKFGWKDPFLTYFYAGYEGTTIDDVENEGHARLGLYVYNQFNSLHDKCSPFQSFKSTSGCGFALVFPHVYGNIYQSGSAESSPDEDDTASSASGDDFDAKVEQTMEVNVGAFWPFYLHPQPGHFERNGVLAVGLVAEHGWRKTASGGQFIQRAYRGLRLAFAPDSYVDLMYGDTDGRKGRRVELRGQYPVSDFSVGRLFLGGALNYDYERAEEDTDSMRIYVIYHASFSEAFGDD
jgi:hypothetical protein